MANTFEVASDPMRLVDLEEREGRAGLSRLAEYFSTTGEPMPPALQRAVAFRRNVGSSDAAATGAGFSYANPYALADLAKRAGPEALFEEARALANAGRPLPVALTQVLMQNRNALFSGKRDAATVPFTPTFDFAANLEPETRPVAPTLPATPVASKEAENTELEKRAMDLRAGTADEKEARKVPPWEYSPSGLPPPSYANLPKRAVPTAAPARDVRPASVARPAISSPMPGGVIEGPVPPYALEDVSSVPSSVPGSFQPPKYTVEEAFSPPAFVQEDVAQGPTREAVAKIAKRSSSGMPLSSPIPTASATTTAAAPTATTEAIAPTGPQAPAGQPDSAGTRGLPAPEGTGGDASERDLYLARLAAQSAAGFGGMGAGKSIDMGIADTLGERLKQVQALRAKREEQSLEQQRERATWGASNRSTLASALAQWKGDPEKTAALEALASGADTTKPGDFSRNAVNAVMTKPKVLGAEAGVTKIVAQADAAKQAPGFKEREVKVKEGTLEERKRAAQTNEELRRRAILTKKSSDTKAATDIRAAGNDTKAAEKAITRAMETAETDKLGIAGNVRDFQGLEKVAPGFTRGNVPAWLGQGSIEAARKVPALSKQASHLASALETFIAGIRKSLFGASLTGNEKESFDAIVSGGLLMPPDVLAANINRLREGAAKFAQNHFTVAQTLHPEVTSRVLGASSLFGPAVAKGGIYSDVWTLPAVPAAATGAGPAARPPKPADKPGTKTLWNKKRGTWVQYGPDAEAKARADNAVED